MQSRLEVPSAEGPSSPCYTIERRESPWGAASYSSSLDEAGRSLAGAAAYFARDCTLPVRNDFTSQQSSPSSRINSTLFWKGVICFVLFTPGWLCGSPYIDIWLYAHERGPTGTANCGAIEQIYRIRAQDLWTVAMVSCRGQLKLKYRVAL